MEEGKKQKGGKKKCKPFCSSSQMGRLSVCITIMEFRAHWQKFTNSSQHPARINNVEALEWRLARRVSKYQSRSAVCSTKQRRPLIVESWKKFGGQTATTVLVLVFGGRRWGGGEVGLLALIWPANITPGGDDITAAAATPPLILFSV